MKAVTHYVLFILFMFGMIWGGTCTLLLIPTIICDRGIHEVSPLMWLCASAVFLMLPFYLWCWHLDREYQQKAKK